METTHVFTQLCPRCGAKWLRTLAGLPYYACGSIGDTATTLCARYQIDRLRRQVAADNAKHDRRDA